MKALSLVIFATVAGSSLQGGAGAPADAPPEPTLSVTWGGLAFDEPAALSAWLRERGLSYGKWAANHPRTATRLEIGLYGTAPPLALSAPSGSPLQGPSQATPDHRSWRGARTTLLTGALAAVALTLLVLALLPTLRLQRVRLPASVARHQPEFAGAGIAVAAALAAALLL